MNAPFESPGTDCRFKTREWFARTPDSRLVGSEGADRGSPGNAATVTIASFDWGAFGKVKVTAVIGECPLPPTHTVWQVSPDLSLSASSAVAGVLPPSPPAIWSLFRFKMNQQQLWSRFLLVCTL